MASLLDTFLDSEMIPNSAVDSVHAYDGCLLFISRWLVVNGYESPVTLMPLPYHDKNSLRIVTKRAGGLIEISQLVAERVGVKPKFVEDLQRGDIGLVQAPHIVRGRSFWTLAFAIKESLCGNKWAMKGEDGLIIYPLKPVVGWGVDSQCPNY